MNYQIYGDKLTIYLDDNIAKQNEISELLASNDIEWVIIDCGKVSALNSDMLDLLVECTSGTAEVVAINANEAVSSMLMMCFIEVSLGFHYVPDVNNMKLILRGNSPDIEFVNEKIFDFLKTKKLEDDEEMSLHKKIIVAIDEVNEKTMDFQKLEIDSTVLENKITIDIVNTTTGNFIQVSDISIY